MFVVGWAIGYGASAARAQPVMVADESVLWLIQPIKEPDSPSRQVRILRTTVSKPFAPPLYLTVRRGQIDRVAVSSGRLHAFFSDGTYYRFFERQAVQGRKLPGGALPLAVAGRDADGSVLAVLPAHTVRRIVEENEERERFYKEDRTETQPAPSTQPAAEPTIESAPPVDFGEGLWLVEYASRRWEPLEPLPDFVGLPVQVDLAAGPNQLALVWKERTPEAGTDLRYAEQIGGRWSEPAFIPQSGDLIRPALYWTEKGPLLLALVPGASGPNATECVAIARRDGTWGVTRLLSADGSALEVQADSSAVVAIGAKVCTVSADSDSEVRWGLWPAVGGPPEQDFKRLPILAPPPRAFLSRRGSAFLSYFLLFGLFALVFWRRQASMLEPAALPPGIAPAGYGRRALGFLLDFAPAIVFTSFFYVRPFGVLQSAMTQSQADPAYLQPYLEALWVPWLVTRSVYTGYCLAWELVRGRTPGKMAMQTAVCSIDGTPCTRRRTLSRNLLRLIELEPLLLIWPLFLLLAVSRNRQRFGDIWSRTVVVQRVPHPPPPRPLGEPDQS